MALAAPIVSFSKKYSVLIAAHREVDVSMQACQCFLSNQICFLDSPKWLKLYRNLTTDNCKCTMRTELAILLGVVIIGLPRITQKVTALVHSWTSISPKQIEASVKAVHDVRRHMEGWRPKYQALLAQKAKVTQRTVNPPGYYALAGTARCAETILNRLLGAVSPQDRETAEAKAQSASQEVLQMVKTLNLNQTPSSAFMEPKFRLAISFVETTEIWADSVSSGSIINAKIFDHWCAIMGRTVPSTGTE